MYYVCTVFAYLSSALLDTSHRYLYKLTRQVAPSVPPAVAVASKLIDHNYLDL